MVKNINYLKKSYKKIIRILTIAAQGFKDDGCEMRASALTFYSLLSVVPAVAVLFGIAKGFGFEKLVQKELYKNFLGNKEFLDKIFEFSNSLLENTKGDIIAVIGLVILFWTIIKVLSNTESSFNKIWKINESRSFIRRFSDYMSLMFISPIIIIFSSALNVFIQRQISNVLELSKMNVIFDKIIQFGLSLLPYLLIYVLLTVVYLVMPNTKVNIKSSFLGALFAGTLYQIVQWIYINFQIGAVRYNAIYGSFAIIPLLLLWFRLSWVVVLFGGEISFAHQNLKSYEHQKRNTKISIFKQRVISFIILKMVVDNFIKRNKNLDKQIFAEELEIPLEIVSFILENLVNSKLLSEIKQKNSDNITYQPAVTVDILTVKYVLNSLEKQGNDKLLIKHNKKTKTIYKYIKETRKKIIDGIEDKLIKDIEIEKN